MSQESALEVLHELTAAGLLSSDAVTRFSIEIESGIEALLEKLIAEEVITPWQAEKFRSGLASDIFLGEYLVLKELGRGGMGTVLLARHRRMDREVAIKVLPVTAMESESAVARFFQEVKVAAKLIHPNIVHAYDAGEHKGFHYLVMEYVEGHDLAHVVHEIGPLPLSMAMDYVRQAAVGLKWAHGEKSVIHRDIKPSNLLLDSRGNIKILDMGLARGAGNGSLDGKSIHLTTTGQVMGTVEFMSPEQAEDTRLADERSDIYSLGCTLYRLLSNIGPFSRDTVVKTILAHRNDSIPQLPGAGDPLQVGAQRIFEKMVAKVPAERYQNMDDLLFDIDRIDELALEDREALEDRDEEPVTHLADEDVVEFVDPLPAQVMETVSPSTATAKVVGKTAVAVRIADDGSMTDLPSVEEVLDLTGNELAHIAPSSSSSNPYTPTQPLVDSTPTPRPAQPVQQEVFRIDDDKPARGFRLAIASFFSLALSAIPSGIPALIAGPIVWWFAWRQQKQIVKGKRRFERLQLTRWSKYAAIVATAIGIIQFLVFFNS